MANQSLNGRQSVKKNYFYMARIFIGLLFVLFLVSCHKNEQESGINNSGGVTDSIEPCSNHPTGYPPAGIDTILKEFCFKTGSYWIYYNDSLHSYDSVVLRNVVSGCESVLMPQHNYNNSEYYCMYYICYPSGYKYCDVIEQSSMMRNFFPTHYYSWDEWELFLKAIPPWNYYIDSLQVGSHMFYTVFESDSKGKWNPTNIKAFTAKGIGIVRKIIKGQYQQDWNLVRWKIIK